MPPPVTNTTTPSPARLHNHPRPERRHYVHHIEPSGHIHTFCGMVLSPQNGASIAPHSDKETCTACIAAQYLFEAIA